MSRSESTALLLVADYPFVRMGDEFYAEVPWDESFARLYRPEFARVVLLGRVRQADEIPPGWFSVDREYFEVLDGGDWEGITRFVLNLPRLWGAVRRVWSGVGAVYLKLFYLNSLAVFFYNLLRFRDRKPVVTLLVGDAAEAVLLRRDLLTWSWQRKLARLMVRWTIRVVQRSAAVPGYWARTLARQYGDTRPIVVVAAEPWVKAEHIRVHDRRAPRQPATILFVGRLVERKRPAHLIRSVADLVREGRDIRLVLVGDGPERAGLEALVRREGLSGRVAFTGWLGLLSDRMLAEYDRADIFCLPSYAEGLPLVVLEAMARGVAVVATAVNATPEVVRHGETGLLVPRDDVPALTKALRSLLSDARLWRSCVEGGYRVVREYTYEAQRGKLAAATKALI